MNSYLDCQRYVIHVCHSHAFTHSQCKISHFSKTFMKTFPYSDVLIVEIVHNVRVCNKSSKTYCFNMVILPVVEVSSLQLHSKKSTLY